MHRVQARGILSAQHGMNLYRGCTHGCIYCDSRSTCYQFTHPFEDIEIKENAPELLEAALRSMKHKCMIATGSMSDPYLPLEKTEQLTRRCLQVIDRHGFGAAVLTKSTLFLRDLDLLESINRKAKAVVQMTLTTADEGLCRILEPNAPTTGERAEALYTCRERGIPTVVWLSPILPFINDTEENIGALLDICIRAGVRGILCFGMGLTLREGNREYFYAALDRSFPGMKQRYVRAFGNHYEAVSPNNDRLMALLREGCEANGILLGPEKCFEYLQAFPEHERQLSMFD